MKYTRTVTLLFSGLFFLYVNIFGQNESAWNSPPELTVSGFVDVFYVYDFNEPTTETRLPFIYNHNRHNEFNLNLGYIGFGVDQQKYRAIIVLQTGTYANDNYTAEPGVLKNIFEAYAGISLNRRNNLWLDAGIFQSHIGFESAVSIDNWTLTRSLTAENTPFFLAGAKLTYAPSAVVALKAILTNGWQRIQRVPGNSFPSLGTQLLITPNEKYTINWSTFIGTDDPDSTRRMRYFSHMYGQLQFNEQFGIIAGFDFGFQQESKGSEEFNSWYGLTLIARYAFAKKWATAIRGELYYDDKGVIVVIEDSPNGFRTSGLSINIDFIPIKQVACRLEGRWLHSPDDIFVSGSEMVQDNVFVSASIAVKFDKTFSGKK